MTPPPRSQGALLYKSALNWRFYIKVPVVLAAVGALLLTACSSGSDEGGGFDFVSPGGTTDIHYDASDRQSVTLSGDSLREKGKTVSTDDFRGKVVVVNIWGSWCGPCRDEAPELRKLDEKTKDKDVALLGIAVRETDRQSPQDFMRNRGLDYASIYDPPGRSLLPLHGYPTSVVPSTLVLDKQHRVAAVYLRDILAKDLLPLVHRLTKESGD